MTYTDSEISEIIDRLDKLGFTLDEVQDQTIYITDPQSGIYKLEPAPETVTLTNTDTDKSVERDVNAPDTYTAMIKTLNDYIWLKSSDTLQEFHSQLPSKSHNQ